MFQWMSVVTTSNRALLWALKFVILACLMLPISSRSFSQNPCYYRLSSGQVFGPFPESSVLSWYSQGYFDKDTEVCNAQDQRFMAIEDFVNSVHQSGNVQYGGFHQTQSWQSHNDGNRRKRSWNFSKLARFKPRMSEMSSQLRHKVASIKAASFLNNLGKKMLSNPFNSEHENFHSTLSSTNYEYSAPIESQEPSTTSPPSSDSDTNEAPAASSVVSSEEPIRITLFSETNDSTPFSTSIDSTTTIITDVGNERSTMEPSPLYSASMGINENDLMINSEFSYRLNRAMRKASRVIAKAFNGGSERSAHDSSWDHDDAIIAIGNRKKSLMKSLMAIVIRTVVISLIMQQMYQLAMLPESQQLITMLLTTAEVAIAQLLAAIHKILGNEGFIDMTFKSQFVKSLILMIRNVMEYIKLIISNAIEHSEAMTNIVASISSFISNILQNEIALTTLQTINENEVISFVISEMKRLRHNPMVIISTLAVVYSYVESFLK